MGFKVISLRHSVISAPIPATANDNLHLRLVCDNTSSDRLLTATQAAPGNYSYIYDRLDNATSVTTPSGTVTPTYNGFNQLKTYGASTYAYDLTGNTLNGDGTRSYKWDAENRLVEIDYSSGAKSNFSYDGMGHRTVDVETAVGGATTTTRYMWCGSTVCQTRNGSDTVLRRDTDEGEYVPAPTSKFLYLPDQLGSTRDVVSATGGALASSFDYGPYGEITRSNGAAQIDYRYAGLFYHPQSALNLATYRAQDTGTSMGRWLNRDPIRELGGINLYGYVGANPISNMDSEGLAGTNLGPTRLPPRDCNSKELAECQKTCGSKGVESCKVAQTMRLTGVNNTNGFKGIIQPVDAPVSCSCNDPEDQGGSRGNMCTRNPKTCVAFIIIGGTAVCLATGGVAAAAR